jgi:hypothetical protein
MSRHLPQTVVNNFLATHTRALRLSELPEGPSSRQCPICRTDYSDQDPSYVHPLYPYTDFEYPVQVFNCGNCTHIFGRLCIERHIRSDQPWSHTCPLCRGEWLPPNNHPRAMAVTEMENALDVLARMDRTDEAVRVEVERVETALHVIRNLLYGPRWI